MARVIGCAVTVLLLAGAAWAADPIERILARVDGQAILLSDLRVARALGLGGVRTDDEEIVALRRLVDRQLVLIEVLRNQPVEPDAAAVARVAQGLTLQAGGAARLAGILTAAGLPSGYVQRLAREQVWTEVYARQRFGEDASGGARASWVRDLRRRGTVACRLPGC